MRIAICDDEQFYVDLIYKKISSKSNSMGLDCNIVTFTCVKELLNNINAGEIYDILYLDIDFKNENGIEIAHNVRKIHNDIVIIFVTSFIQYCPKGYEVNALRYILKDDRVFEKLLEESFEKAIEQIHMGCRTMAFRFKEGNKVLRLSDIVYIESVKHVLNFYVANNREIDVYTQRGRLDELEKSIQDKRFCRIHKSYLINMDYVESTRRYTASLSHNIELSISKSKYNDVLKHR